MGIILRPHWRRAGRAALRQKIPLFVALLTLAGCQWGRENRPDVVVITLDTTRPDHLGPYGYERETTPQIDRFARDSVVFSRAWSTSNWTYPAHASLLTGLHPATHGAHLDGDGPPKESVTLLRDDVPTLAELLRERGYATGAWVGGPWLAPEFRLLRGYDVQDAEFADAGGILLAPSSPANVLTDRALSFLEAVDAERPVHLLVNYFDPHAPYDVHVGFDMRRNRRSKDKIPLGAGKPTGEERQDMIDRYDGEIRFMDHHVGRLLDGLRRAGRYDGALIIITGDHGDLFGENEVWRHGASLYEGVLRVPLMVHWPGARDAGTARDAPVSIVDVLGLVSSEVGFVLPESNEGRVIGERRLVIAESRRNATNRRLYGKRFDGNLYTLIRWPWKLIHLEGGDTEIFRLDMDQREQIDLADEPRSPRAELVRDLRSARHQLSPPPTKLRLGQIEGETLKRLEALGYVQQDPE